MDKFVDVRARGQESQSAIDNLMERFNPFEKQLQQQQDNSSVRNTISTDTTTEPNQTGFHQTTCRTPLSIAYHPRFQRERERHKEQAPDRRTNSRYTSISDLEIKNCQSALSFHNRQRPSRLSSIYDDELQKQGMTSTPTDDVGNYNAITFVIVSHFFWLWLLVDVVVTQI